MSGRPVVAACLVWSLGCIEEPLLIPDSAAARAPGSRAGAFAERARVAAVAALLVAHQVEEAHAARLVHQLAALEVDAFEYLVESGALGLRHPRA
jgi:hypothetical protein